MKQTTLWRRTKHLSLLATLLVSGCATTMQMSPEELKTLQPNEGIVIGSVHIKGGKDILGRTKWNLAAKKTDYTGTEYSIQAHREGEEEFFAVRMVAGDYRFYKLYQEGFSTFTSFTNIRFKVESGKTKYLGRLVIEFPPEFLTVMTKFKIEIEDIKEQAIGNVAKKTGLTVRDVATDLMTSQECITEKSITSILLKKEPLCL